MYLTMYPTVELTWAGLGSDMDPTKTGQWAGHGPHMGPTMGPAFKSAFANVENFQ